MLTPETFPTTRPLTPAEFSAAVGAVVCDDPQWRGDSQPLRGRRRPPTLRGSVRAKERVPFADPFELMTEGVAFALERGDVAGKVFESAEHFRRWLYSMCRAAARENRKNQKTCPEVDPIVGRSDATYAQRLKGSALRFQSFECPMHWPAAGGRVPFSTRTCPQCKAAVPEGAGVGHRDWFKVVLPEDVRRDIARRLGLDVSSAPRHSTPNFEFHRGDAVRMPGKVAVPTTTAARKAKLPGRHWPVAHGSLWVGFTSFVAELHGGKLYRGADGQHDDDAWVKARGARRQGSHARLAPEPDDDGGDAFGAPPSAFLPDYLSACILTARLFAQVHAHHIEGALGPRTVVGRRKKGRGAPQIRTRQARGAFIAYASMRERAESAQRAFLALFKDDPADPVGDATALDKTPYEYGRELDKPGVLEQLAVASWATRLGRVPTVPKAALDALDKAARA